MRFWSQRMPYLRDFAKDHRVLHMGPGREESLGIAVDNLRAVRPNVLANLNRAPYPFRDDSFDAAYAFSVVEHLDNFFDVFGELHRILKPGGFVALLTPHFSNDSSFIDPSHRLHLSLRSFDYFIEGTELFATYGFYSKTRFRVREKLLIAPRKSSRGARALASRPKPAANRLTSFYERHLCYLVRGRGMYLELEAVTSTFCGLHSSASMRRTSGEKRSAPAAWTALAACTTSGGSTSSGARPARSASTSTREAGRSACGWTKRTRTGSNT